MRLVPACLGAVLVAAGACAHAQLPALPRPDAADENFFATVVVNLQPMGDRELHRDARGRFWIAPADLAGMGFRDDLRALAVERQGRRLLPLDAIPGAKLTFDESRVQLSIVAPPQAFSSRVIAPAGATATPSPQGQEFSAYVNYALDFAGGGARAQSRPALSTEAVAASAGHVLVSRHATLHDATGRGKFARLGTTYSFDDVQRLRTYIAGDLTARGWELGGGANLVGLAVRRAFELDPYFVSSPRESVGGTAQFPSQLEVYVDGQLVRSERLAPGTFEVRDIAATVGARELQYVLRDPFGNEQRVTRAAYFSDRLLKGGTQEFIYAAGRLARTAASGGLRYGPAAALAHHRWGYSDRLSLGARFEAAGGYVLAGATMSAAFASAGTVDLALAQTKSGARQGRAGHFAYNYQTSAYGFAASARATSAGFAQLGAPPVVAGRSVDVSTSAVWRLPSGPVLSATWLPRSESAGLARARGFALGLGAPLVPGRVYLQATLRRMERPGGPDRAFAFTLTFYSGQATAAAGMRRDGNATSQSVRFEQPPPVGPGWGYQLNAGRQDSPPGAATDVEASAQYNAQAAIVRAQVQASTIAGADRSTRYAATLAGSAGVVNGHFFTARPVADGFAIVKVEGLGGVGVQQYGREAARTDARGLAVLPNLHAYSENEIAIDADTLPVDRGVESVVQKVVPFARAGRIVEFALRKSQEFVGKLLWISNGQRTAFGEKTLTLRGPGGDRRVDTGPRGSLYMDQLAPGRYTLHGVLAEGPCTAAFEVKESTEPVVELGELTCEPR